MIDGNLIVVKDRTGQSINGESSAIVPFSDVKFHPRKGLIGVVKETTCDEFEFDTEHPPPQLPVLSFLEEKPCTLHRLTSS